MQITSNGKRNADEMKPTSSFQSSKASASLKLLTETEKLQLLQLQKTRERIQKELKKYPGADVIDYDDDDIGFGANSKPNSAYGKSRRSMRIGTGFSTSGSRPGSQPSKKADYFETIRQGLDMMPVMATTGSAAIGGGDAKGKIKLPIFKLPSIDAEKVKSMDHNKNLERTMKSGGFVQQYIPYRDMSGYRKALVLMIKALSQKDATFIQNLLDMTPADIADLEGELRKPLQPSLSLASHSKTPRRTPKGSPQRTGMAREQSMFFPADNNNSNTSLTAANTAANAGNNGNGQGGEVKETILDTLFREDPNMSVFLLAKDAVVLNKREEEDAVAAESKEALQYSKALRNITSKMDMSALGLSDSMTRYLTQGAAAVTQPTTVEGLQKLKGNVSTALGGFVSAGAAHHQAAVAQAAVAEAALQASPAVRKIGSMPQLYHVRGAADSLQSTYGRKNKVRSGRDGHKKHSGVRLMPLMSRTDGLAQSSLFSQTSGVTMHSQSRSLSVAASSGGAGGAGLGGGKMAATASASDLTQALMASLRTMQAHSNMIKESISSAQSVITITDPKAKGLIFQVAAEAMFRALQPLLLYEIKRGFAAWMFVVRQERRAEKAGDFIHFLTLRNCLMALDAMVRRCLVRIIRKWKDFTQFEIKRLLKERTLKAVLKLQAAFRTRLARKKVELLRQRRKYQKLYDSTIKIQALFRGKLQRWRFLRETRDKARHHGATVIQCLVRGYQARKRVHFMRLRRNKALAATTIQKIVRGRLATKRVQIMLKNRRFGMAATKIQSFIRGFLSRKHMARILIELAQYKYVVKIQAMVRGALGRIHLHKKIAAMQEYRENRHRAATKIQSAYRGYRCSVLYKMMMHKMNKVKKEQNRAATQIGRIVRGFVARAYLRDLKIEQRNQWIADARIFKETWAEDSESWFYYNEATGEALWEPSALGYTKSDGLLVLANGEIIEDPAKITVQKRYNEDGEEILDGEEGEGDEEPVEVIPDKKKNSRLCSECGSRVAIRACNECGDKFCTKCYKFLHSTGTRRTHTFTAVGPLDCTECELRLAERWCVSCDENFCDGCWRKVHSKGKRAFHPYSEISAEGRIDARIFTMDGDQLSDYDSSYAQQRVDVNSYNTKQAAVQDALQQKQQQQGYQQQQAGQGGGYEGYGGDGYNYASADESTVAMYEGSGYGGSSWEQYYDENGYAYWYDAATGASQYEPPEGYG